jgi:O-antigen/teichoic acid export membrane protein
LYGLVLTAVARPLLHVLYAGKYDEHWPLIGLFGLSTAASVATGVFVLALKACRGAQAVAVIWGLPAGLVAVTAVPLMRLTALEGAISVAAAAYLVACGIAYTRLLGVKGYRDDRAD